MEKELNQLRERDRSLYKNVVDQANSSMRELRTGTVARIANREQAAALDMVDQARKGTASYLTWDFSRMEDRILMGDAATALIRQMLGLNYGD